MFQFNCAPTGCIHRFCVASVGRIDLVYSSNRADRSNLAPVEKI